MLSLGRVSRHQTNEVSATGRPIQIRLVAVLRIAVAVGRGLVSSIELRASRSGRRRLAATGSWSTVPSAGSPRGASTSRVTRPHHPDPVIAMVCERTVSLGAPILDRFDRWPDLQGDVGFREIGG